MIKLGSMLGDILEAIYRAPATERYPDERRPTPDRLRGLVRWNPEGCTGCRLCVKDCPADALELIEIDRKDKRFAMRYHIDKCAFCSQCVSSCRRGCIDMANDAWELAALQPDDFSVLYGHEEDIEDVMADSADEQNSAAAAEKNHDRKGN